GALRHVVRARRELGTRTARAPLRAAELPRRDAERTLGFAVEAQYVATAQARASLGLAEESRAASAETLRLVQARYDAGDVSEADVARAEAAALETEQARDLAVQTLRQAQVALAFMLGVRSAVPDFDLPEEPLTPSESALPVPVTAESLIVLALAQRADVAASEAQQARALAGLRLAERERVPDLSLGVQYVREGVGQSAIAPPTTTFGLSLTPPPLSPPPAD